MKILSRSEKRPTLRALADEVALLRSFLIGVAGRDPEGVYRPEFVADMLRVSANAAPRREFLGVRDFLHRMKRSA